MTSRGELLRMMRNQRDELERELAYKKADVRTLESDLQRTELAIEDVERNEKGTIE